MPVDGSSLTTRSFGSGRAVARQPQAEPGRALEHEPELGLRRRQQLAGADEERHARPAPVVDLQAQRGVRLGGRVRPPRRECRGSRRTGRARTAPGRRRRPRARARPAAFLIGGGVAPGRRLHRAGGDDLHEVVDDDVAQRADRVVEVSAVLDAEALGHRDLHGLDVVAVPDRLEHRVGEPEVEQLLQAHLAEEVVDAVKLRLVDVLVHLRGERPGRLQVVAERLLDHHPARRGSGRHRPGPCATRPNRNGGISR